MNVKPIKSFFAKFGLDIRRVSDSHQTPVAIDEYFSGREKPPLLKKDTISGKWFCVKP